MNDEDKQRILTMLRVEGQIVRTLLKLSDRQRRRVMAYLWDRYVMNPEPPPRAARP